MNLNIIKAPELTSSTFGDDVSKVFDQIDENFRRVSSYDFIKGETGDSLNIIEHNFADDIDSNNSIIKGSVAEAVLNSIYNIPGVTKENTIDINNISVEDDFIKKIAGSILLIYNDNLNNTDRADWKKNLCGCMPYTFLDPRFSSLNVDESNIEKWKVIIDCSCIITWSANKFTSIQSFPTLYYDFDQNQFCWKLSNKKTGLIARGPRGIDGKSGNYIICLVRRSEEASGTENAVNDGSVNLNGVYPIAYYLTGSTDDAVDIEGSNWVKVESLNSEWNGSNAIVFETDATSDDPTAVSTIASNIYWISNISQKLVNGVDKNVVNLSNANAITSDISIDSFLNILNNINVNKPDGLFIPMRIDNTSDTEPVHMITSDQLGVYNTKNQLLIGPVSRYDKADEIQNKIRIFYKSDNCNYILNNIPSDQVSGGTFEWVSDVGGYPNVINDTLRPVNNSNMKVELIDDYSIDQKMQLAILYNVACLGDLNLTSVSGNVILSNDEIDSIVQNIIN